MLRSIRVSFFAPKPYQFYRYMSIYESLSREELIARLTELEGANSNAQSPTKKQLAGPSRERKPKKEAKEFNFSAFPRRKIALKFCYHGWEYNGLAVQGEPTPLPTVEEVLFDALCESRLVEREKGFEGCDWSRCGRTDRGVSAAGQAVALWVRSAIKQPLTADEDAVPTEGESVAMDGEVQGVAHPPKSGSTPVQQELRYVLILNRILPPSIRVLAWSPVSDDFSARFNCRRRHYKYFFNSLPLPSPPLDLDRLQDAASRLVGEHDFRNFCKLDGSKQIERYGRRIDRAEISVLRKGDKIRDGTVYLGDLYVLDLAGSAFLWHQVRHIMAILFLIGHGLEQPSVIDALLNTNPENPHPDSSIPLVRARPIYEMAAGLPLILWDCGFDEADVQWRTEDASMDEGYTANASGFLWQQVHGEYSRSLVHAILHQHFLEAASLYHNPPTDTRGVAHVNIGGGQSRYTRKYVPLLKRKRGDTVEVVNERWRNGARAAKKVAKSLKIEETYGPE
jgi:tRNA pseudouridine38/39 synthase